MPFTNNAMFSCSCDGNVTTCQKRKKTRMERTREFRIFAQILKSLWLQCRILMAHAVPLAPAR